MAYHSKKTTDLDKIGAEEFALLDEMFPGGHKPKPPSPAATAPPSRTPQQLFPYQYQPQQPLVVQQLVYAAPAPAKMTEKVLNSYEAAKIYGGIVRVDYSKWKPTRKGFFR